MATLSTTRLNLADWSKQLDPDGNIATVVELLNQLNEVTEDMIWVEGNGPTTHRTSVRTSLPSGTFRRFNEGVASTKSTASQVTDSMGMLEIYSDIDKSLADLNGNSAKFRLNEDRAFLEGLVQQFAGTLFYGNTGANPERFMGLAPRYNTTSTGTSQTANNLISGGGSGSDNSSIWLVVWDELTCHGIFPKGSKAGLQMKDLGEVTILTNSSLDKMQGYRTHYKWDCGLTVRDWRYVVRVANIDISDLAGASPADLPKLMSRAMARIPNMKMGRPAWYMNRTVKQWLDIQRTYGPGTGTTQTTNSNVRRTLDQSDMKIFHDFGGIPIRICDQITNAEATVS